MHCRVVSKLCVISHFQIDDIVFVARFLKDGYIFLPHLVSCLCVCHVGLRAAYFCKLTVLWSVGLFIPQTALVSSQ